MIFHKNYFQFTAFLLMLFLISCTAGEEPPLQVLLITGGGWHDYETQEVLLTEGISERLGDAIEWTIIHEGDKEPDYHVSVLQEENWTQGFDVVVHNTGFGRVTDPEFVAGFVEHHKGTPAVLVHAAVHSYRYAEPADPWFEFMGFQSMWHEGQRQFEVENIAPENPVMNNQPEKWMTPEDEVYVVERIWGDITPLARAYGTETEEYQTVTWTHEIDGTRIFATTLGHNNEMFEKEEFLDQVANGLLWAAGRL
ncbi:MAG: ThuA domain-containing protein [Balneolaceae bacterium]